MISETLEFDIDLEIIAEGGSVDIDWYEGAYEFTPSQSEQTIEIAKQTAKQNITINPIPNNYGKVSQVGNDLVIE